VPHIDKITGKYVPGQGAGSIAGGIAQAQQSAPVLTSYNSQKINPGTRFIIYFLAVTVGAALH
jgi:hypothetical protein